MPLCSLLFGNTNIEAGFCSAEHQGSLQHPRLPLTGLQRRPEVYELLLALVVDLQAHIGLHGSLRVAAFICVPALAEAFV